MRFAPPAAEPSGERSLWMQQALGAEDPAERRARPLTGAVTCDVCVVGAGYTGLWTALRLQEADPSLEIVVLEAGISGSGASGRNGGFATAWWHDVEAFERHFGAEQARFLCEASSRALGDVEAFCRDTGIDARFRRHGKIWGSTAPAQDGAWLGAQAAAARLGHPEQYVPVAPEEVRRRIGSPVLRGGVAMPDAASVHPALLVRGLRRVAIERGIRIHEHSPMTRLDGGGPVVHTSRATVRARRVVLAVNAWATALPEVRRVVVPLSSHVVVTEPVPDRLRELGWTGGELLVDSRMLLHYTHVTADGRVAFGRGGGAVGFRGRVGGRVLWDPALARAVAADLRRFFPSLADVRIDAAWGGAVDRSWRHIPFFSALPDAPDVFVGVGFSGDGIVPCAVGGRILASLVRGVDDEWTRCALTRIPDHRVLPPEPLRKLGGELVRQAVARKESAEERGDRPGSGSTALARLAWFSLPSRR